MYLISTKERFTNWIHQLDLDYEDNSTNSNNLKSNVVF